MHETHRRGGMAVAITAAPADHRPCRPTPSTPATRERLFHLVTEGIAAGLPVPVRVLLPPGHRRLGLDLVEQGAWNRWRTWLNCADVRIRVYDSRGTIRRACVARGMRAGCRIDVRLIEDVDLTAIRPGAPDVAAPVVAAPVVAAPVAAGPEGSW